MDRLRFRPPLLGVHAVDHLFGELEIEGVIEHNFVFLLHLVAGMRELEGERPVVGQDDQALAFAIESAHMEQPWEIRREQIENSPAVVRVRSGAEESRRFVEQERGRRSRVQYPVSHLDHVSRFNPGCQCGAPGAVDRYLSGLDQFLAAPAGPESSRSQKLVKSHWLEFRVDCAECRG